ncbi:phage tail protein [Rhodococcus hoagii]|nr:phage tail protein [Prescottella equi]
MTTPVANLFTDGSWSPAAAAAHMDGLSAAEQQEWLNPACDVRVFDKFYNEEGVCGDYLDLEFSLVKNVAGGLDITLPGDTPLRDHLLHNPDGADATIPIVVDTPGMRWPGKITTVRLVRFTDGTEVIEIEALHDLEHVAHISMWPAPFAPLEAQFPRHMILVGPTETVIKTFLAKNLMRLQLPLWTIPDNIFDPSAWFDIGNAMFPIAVVPANPFTDTSKWCALSARMQMGDELFAQALKDAGLVLTAKLFLPERDPQPAPQWFTLSKPTIVLDIVDKSGVTGPTGTFVDGLISYVAEFLDDGVTPILHPVINPDEPYDPDYFQGLLGVKPGKPWAVWREGQYSGIGESEIAIHKPMASSVIVGGKSPDWVNAGISLAIRSLLSWLGLLIGVPGLDALYQGQLDDVFLAFQKFTDRARERRAGPYGYQESFQVGSGSAYTLDAILAGREGLYSTRGYVSHKVTVEDNAPYIFGLHMEVGDIVGFELGGSIYTDYISAATFRDDRKTRATWTLTIGDGSDDEDPIARAHRKLGDLLSIVKEVSLDTGVDFGLGFI